MWLPKKKAIKYNLLPDVLVQSLSANSASGGYSLHANTSIKSHEKDRLEKLIRYMSRPPFSDDSLHITESGMLE